MKKLVSIAIAAPLAAGMVYLQPAMAQIDLGDDDTKKSYSLGLMIGDRITPRYGELNYEALVEGIRAQHEGAEAQMSLDEAQAALQDYEQKARLEQATAAAENGENYQKENGQRDEVTTTDSGLQYEVLTEGSGDKPTATDRVSVHYVGTLINGKEFDSSVARGEPAEFGLNGVIPGWTEGLQLMNVGSKYRFVIPPDLAYGERGAGADIGPGETLIFEVEMLEIK
jgi:FKBP-type peptidyl-prolyl cis-trans isomerase